MAQYTPEQRLVTEARLPVLAEELGIGGSGSGVEEVSGTVPLDASGPPIREFFTTGATTFKANGTGTLISSFTAVVWRRDGSGRWAYQAVQEGWTTPTAVPDTTPPTAGSLAVSDVQANSAVLTVSGASDAQGLDANPFRFSVDNGVSWSLWQSSASYTAGGLVGSTSYTAVAEVRDAAGLTARTVAKSFTTGAEPVVPYVFPGATGASLTGATYRGRQFQTNTDGPYSALGTQGSFTPKDVGLTLTGAGAVTGKGWNFIETGANNAEATFVFKGQDWRAGMNDAAKSSPGNFILPENSTIKFYGPAISGPTLYTAGSRITEGRMTFRAEGGKLTVIYNDNLVGTYNIALAVKPAFALMIDNTTSTISDLLIRPL